MAVIEKSIDDVIAALTESMLEDELPSGRERLAMMLRVRESLEPYIASDLVNPNTFVWWCACGGLVDEWSNAWSKTRDGKCNRCGTRQQKERS